MKITTQTTHTITFSIQAFWSEEGGMGHDTFGKPCETLSAAVTTLDLAFLHEPKTDWVIVCSVTKHVNDLSTK